MVEKSLKKYLIAHPEIAHAIVTGRICFSGDLFMRLLDTYTKDGFTVSSYVDDDELSEEEKVKHHEQLAEAALRAIYTQMRGE